MTNGVIKRQLQVRNFEAFLLSEIPYGRIDANTLRTGGVEYAGLAGLNNSKTATDIPWEELVGEPKHYNLLLPWGFGPHTYPILKAMRLDYEYTTEYSENEVASILIGYEGPLGKAYIPTPGKVPADASAGSKGFVTDTIGDFTTWLCEEIPYGDVPKDKLTQTHVEYAGLAAANNSVSPFRERWDAVALDRAKYEQLLQWPFADRTFRITKAVRVPYTYALNGHQFEKSLLIGYQGPGPY